MQDRRDWMKRIGIMGGTFNPIHNGHLFLAEIVREKLNLDTILFIPTGNPPHKKKSDLLDNHHRYNIVKLAVEENPYFSASDIELSRKGTTYTIDTLKELHKLYYGNLFYFIIGFDTLKEIGTWKDIHEVCRLCSFIVVNRNSSLEDITQEIMIKKAQFHVNIDVVDMPNIDISSTYIRFNLMNSRSIRYLTPDRVINYININGLYK